MAAWAGCLMLGCRGRLICCRCPAPAAHLGCHPALRQQLRRLPSIVMGLPGRRAAKVDFPGVGLFQLSIAARPDFYAVLLRWRAPVASCKNGSEQGCCQPAALRVHLAATLPAGLYRAISGSPTPSDPLCCSHVRWCRQGVLTQRLAAGEARKQNAQLRAVERAQRDAMRAQARAEQKAAQVRPC
jgi:hypothetical protein